MITHRLILCRLYEKKLANLGKNAGYARAYRATKTTYVHKERRQLLR